MKGITWIATALLTSAPLALTHGLPNLRHEHAGDVFWKVHGGGQTCGDGVLHNGSPAGDISVINGERFYVAYPPHGAGNSGAAILYLTDIFGVALINNKLLADSLAKAGHLVVMPDLFRGDPVPADALEDPDSDFDIEAWNADHPQSEIDSIVTTAIATLRDDFEASTIAGVGYCFGGKYIARFLAAGKGLDVGFTAHPSNTLEEEWDAIANPISIAFGELDDSNTPRNRTNIEGIFQSGNKTYQTSLYAGAEHGFAVRVDLTDPKQAFAQESAYFQAVRFFDYWA